MEEVHEIAVKAKRKRTREQKDRQNYLRRETRKKKREEKKVGSQKESVSTKRRDLCEDGFENEDEEDTYEPQKRELLERTLTQQLEDLKILISESCMFKEKQLPNHKQIVAIRFLLMGKNFADFGVYQDFEEQPLSRTEFHKIAAQVYAKVDEIAEQHLAFRKTKYKGKNLLLEIDCRWGTRGNDAYEATVSGFDGETGEIIDRVNIFREKDDPRRNFDGEAKGMEGFGVKLLCERLKEAGINVHTILHDSDSSSFLNAKSIFPDVKENICANHMGKTIR